MSAMGPPERIVAGVVLCERLAVGMYGAVHRAQREGHRHLRALVVEPRLLSEPGFHRELLDSAHADKVIALESEHIVPTLAVESEGPDVVVLTRGVGRYVTVQDMLASARARGFKIERSVVAAVALAAAEALAAAHRAHVVHGAVHPRSVLVDEEGGVRLTDFAVGRALTAAVAQGGDSALWRGLAGFLAPELAIGANPSAQTDVFAMGALLFVMLTGDAPPGTVATTAAVERVVQKALDTEPSARYRTPSELLEALRTAIASDGWAIATAREIIDAAGLRTESTGIDSDTEDLLAAMSSLAPAPVRPNMELRAEAVAARTSGEPAAASLDDLLADLDETAEGRPRARDKRPTSELRPSGEGSGRGARGRARGGASSPRLAPSEPPPTMAEYDVTPLPPPQPQEALLAPLAPELLRDTEDAAMDALSDLRDPTVVNPPAKPVVASAPAASAARREEHDDSVTQLQPRPRAAPPLLEAPVDLPVPSLRRSPLWTAVWGAILVAAVVSTVMVLRWQKERAADEEARYQEEQRRADQLSAQLADRLPDEGVLRLASSPGESTGWMLLGRTPFETAPLSSETAHLVRVELERYQPQELVLDGRSWSGAGADKRGQVDLKLELAGKSPPLGAAPTPPAVTQGLAAGAVRLSFSSEPRGAAVWLYLGVTGEISYRGIAGREYELRVLKDGFLPGYVRVQADDWRAVDRQGKPLEGAIDAVSKKAAIDLSVTLTPDPDAQGGARRKGS